MKIESISVMEDIEGKILAKDIVSSRGILLVAKNTLMNRFIRKRLMDFDVHDVSVYSVEREDSTRERYLENVAETRSILNELASGKGMDIGRLTNLSDSLFREITHSNYIIRQLHRLEEADEYTYAHSVNVAFYSAMIAKWLKYSENEVKMVIQSALLHDIGKIKVPLEILNKRETLRKEEFDEIKRHTIYGYEMVREIAELPEDVKKVILMHHEREDMSGYPGRAKSEEINIFSKIIAVADVYDAMTSDRVYKKGVSPFDAFTMFQTVGQKSFDIIVVNSFLRNLAASYTGCDVLTSTGTVGKVMYIPPHDIGKPVIRIKSDYFDLSRDQDLKILRII